MENSRKENLSVLIKEKAFSIGFDLCGIAQARRLSEYERPLRDWCNAGMNDKMKYMARDMDKRLNPCLLFPGSLSVVVTGMNYYTTKLQSGDDVPVISRYAFGKDYHEVVTGKLGNLLSFIKTIVPEVEGKAFCDSFPVLEKPWAVEAGLGWRGKNSLVINEKTGSFFFIGILLLNVSLDYDRPFSEDKCENCTKCIERCPTGAINNNRTIDARKCIANLTIENRQTVPREMTKLFERRVYGCDICQEVCPWNKNAKPHNNPEFDISEKMRSMTKQMWLSLDRKQFSILFSGTPVNRIGFEKFKKNVVTILNGSG
ncbi:MAG: tRNA epoxyqueuosine(34) reductase QueG [Bacteroidales bacterium]